MDDIYENIDEYSPNKKQKILIVFDGLIADMPGNISLFLKKKYYFFFNK